MAKKSYIKDFERDIIRIGVANDVPVSQIAKFIGRKRNTVYAQIEKMKEDGTIGNLPFPFVSDELVSAMGSV